MGASSAEIDEAIRETRRELDKKLVLLEKRAASGARTYGRVAAGVAAGVVLVAIGVVLYRRRRKRAAVKQLHRVLFEKARNLPGGVTSQVRRRIPIKIVVTDRAHEEGASKAWAGIAEKIAPTVIGTATGALLARFRTPADQPTTE